MWDICQVLYFNEVKYQLKQVNFLVIRSVSDN